MPPIKTTHKITAARKNISKWKTKKEFYIWIIDKKETDPSKKIPEPYAKIKSLFLVDGSHIECAA